MSSVEQMGCPFLERVFRLSLSVAMIITLVSEALGARFNMKPPLQPGNEWLPWSPD